MHSAVADEWRWRFEWGWNLKRLRNGKFQRTHNQYRSLLFYVASTDSHSCGIVQISDRIAALNSPTEHCYSVQVAPQSFCLVISWLTGTWYTWALHKGTKCKRAVIEITHALRQRAFFFFVPPGILIWLLVYQVFVPSANRVAWLIAQFHVYSVCVCLLFVLILVPWFLFGHETQH